jgi:hypothetical protein
MDKLFTELKMSSNEVVVYISNLIQQVLKILNTSRYIKLISFRLTAYLSALFRMDLLNRLRTQNRRLKKKILQKVLYTLFL